MVFRLFSNKICIGSQLGFANKICILLHSALHCSWTDNSSKRILNAGLSYLLNLTAVFLFIDFRK